MPKSAKKRRDKAADFSKAKLKLGKGKQAPTNAIDTSFKARSIALPTQSIAADKDNDVPTTRRRLTFGDLLNHVKHYSAGTRRDGILGLRELLERHPDLLVSSLTPLLDACVRVIGDEDASVRKGLLSFFAWLLQQVPRDSLIPHSPLLLLFTTSAQTHIFPEIRVDAVRFLDLFLEYIPDTLVTGWAEGSSHGSRVLEGYLGILNAGTKFGAVDGPLKATSTASVVLTTASKLVVLQSLSNFLRHALTPPYDPVLKSSVDHPATLPLDGWYLAPSFASREAYEAFNQLLRPASNGARVAPCRTWQPNVELESGDDEFIQSYPLIDVVAECWDLTELSTVTTTEGLSNMKASRNVNISFISHLAHTLYSTLVSTFLDYAPTTFAPGGNPLEMEVKLIVAVADITRTLYGSIFEVSTTSVNFGSALEELRTILGYMTTYFPFVVKGARDLKVEQAFQDLNLIFCELTSLLVRTLDSSCPRTSVSRRRKQGPKGGNGLENSKSSAALSIQVEHVGQYVFQLLRGESMSVSQLGRPLTPAVYAALLPTIWSLLIRPPSTQSETSYTILQAVAEHAIKTSSKSALKTPTLNFISSILLLETEPQYQGHLHASPGDSQALERWIHHLPQTLWELGATNLSTSEVIFRFLLRFFQRKHSLASAKTVATIRSRMSPYFCIAHAVRGQVLGPYAKLPALSPLRRLALDVVAATRLRSADGGDADGLNANVRRAVANTEEHSYWVHLTTEV